MQGWHDTTLLLLQFLSNSAWSGIGVIISSMLSLASMYLSVQSIFKQTSNLLSSQKNLDNIRLRILLT